MSTHRGLINAEEDSSGLYNVQCTSISPRDLGWLHAGIWSYRSGWWLTKFFPSKQGQGEWAEKGLLQQCSSSAVYPAAMPPGLLHLPLKDGDDIVVDDQLPILCTHVTMVTSMCGIIFEHVDLINEMNKNKYNLTTIHIYIRVYMRSDWKCHITEAAGFMM